MMGDHEHVVAGGIAVVNDQRIGYFAMKRDSVGFRRAVDEHVTDLRMRKRVALVVGGEHLCFDRGTQRGIDFSFVATETAVHRPQFVDRCIVAEKRCLGEQRNGRGVELFEAHSDLVVEVDRRDDASALIENEELAFAAQPTAGKVAGDDAAEQERVAARRVQQPVDDLDSGRDSRGSRRSTSRHRTATVRGDGP